MCQNTLAGHYSEWLREVGQPLSGRTAGTLAGIVCEDLAKSVARPPRIARYDPRLIIEKRRAGERIKETQATFGEKLQESLADYQAGHLTRGQVEYRMKRAIREHYRDVFELGKRSAGNLYLIEPHEETWLRKLRYDEFKYLRRFLDDIDNEAGVMAYDRRMDMYSKAIREVYYIGWLMGNRDRRRFIVWHVGDAEHCKDCRAYDGRRWAVEAFIKHVRHTGHVPNSGSLACLGYRCKCWLEEQFLPAYTRQLSDASE